MGIWSSTLFGSGGAIQWQRWQGTLELLVGAPPPFVAVLLFPLTVATSTIGIYSVFATLDLGPHLLRRTARLRAPVPARGRAPGDDPQPRHARAAPRLDVRPLPQCERVLEPSRVPGLARDRPARAAVAAPGLGHAASRGCSRRRGACVRSAMRLSAATRGRSWRSASASASSTSRSARSRCGTSSGSRGAARRSPSRDRVRPRVLCRWRDLVPRPLQLDQPGMYVTTMLGSPLFQILFFTYLGRYAGSRGRLVLHRRQRDPGRGDGGDLRDDDGHRERAAVRDAQPLLATPANRLAIFSGRALPFIVNGLSCRRSASRCRGSSSTSGPPTAACRRSSSPCS